MNTKHPTKTEMAMNLGFLWLVAYHLSKALLEFAFLLLWSLEAERRCDDPGKRASFLWAWTSWDLFNLDSADVISPSTLFDKAFSSCFGLRRCKSGKLAVSSEIINWLKKMRNNSFFIFVKDVPPHWSFRLPFEEYFFVIIIRFRTSQLHIITHALAFNNFSKIILMIPDRLLARRRSGNHCVTSKSLNWKSWLQLYQCRDFLRDPLTTGDYWRQWSIMGVG